MLAPPCLQEAKLKQNVLLSIACCHCDVHVAHALLNNKNTPRGIHAQDVTVHKHRLDLYHSSGNTDSCACK